MQSLFKRFAEFDVALGHARRHFAVLEVAQDPFDPSEVIQGRASFCALGSGALSSGVY
jgi:hypothetical protein